MSESVKLGDVLGDIRAGAENDLHLQLAGAGNIVDGLMVKRIGHGDRQGII